MNYAGDIHSLHSFGFDAVKIDDCGDQRNLTLYAELMKQSGGNYTIEKQAPPSLPSPFTLPPNIFR